MRMIPAPFRFSSFKVSAIPNHLLEVHLAQGAPDIVVGHVRHPECDIVPDRPDEQVRLLLDEGREKIRSVVEGAHLSVGGFDIECTGIDPSQAGEGLDEGRLPAPGRTHDRDDLAGPQFEIEPLDHRRSVTIGDDDVPARHATHLLCLGLSEVAEQFRALLLFLRIIVEQGGEAAALDEEAIPVVGGIHESLGRIEEETEVEGVEQGLRSGEIVTLHPIRDQGQHDRDRHLADHLVDAHECGQFLHDAHPRREEILQLRPDPLVGEPFPPVAANRPQSLEGLDHRLEDTALDLPDLAEGGGDLSLHDDVHPGEQGGAHEWKKGDRSAVDEEQHGGTHEHREVPDLVGNRFGEKLLHGEEVAREPGHPVAAQCRVECVDPGLAEPLHRIVLQSDADREPEPFTENAGEEDGEPETGRDRDTENRQHVEKGGPVDLRELLRAFGEILHQAGRQQENGREDHRGGYPELVLPAVLGGHLANQAKTVAPGLAGVGHPRRRTFTGTGSRRTTGTGWRVGEGAVFGRKRVGVIHGRPSFSG